MPVNIDEVQAEVNVESGGAGHEAHGQRPLPSPREIERWREAARTCGADEARGCAVDRDD